MYKYKHNNKNKATVCVKNTCATVYGDAANLVKGIVVVTTAVLAISAIAKTIK